jgi:hypothetical protein
MLYGPVIPFGALYDSIWYIQNTGCYTHNVLCTVRYYMELIYRMVHCRILYNVVIMFGTWFDTVRHSHIVKCNLR